MTSLLRPAFVVPIPLQELFPQAEQHRLITGISYSSKEMDHGWLYAALPGARVHGAQFADEAISRGAVAILTDQRGAELLGKVFVPVVVVPDPRIAMAHCAARIFGCPTEKLTGFGITGTNGKTTTVALLAAALRRSGRKVGTVGTLGYYLDDEELKAQRTTVTTPESSDLQALLAVMHSLGADSFALEVSSHSLALHRVDAIRFDVAAFLNLGHDHLDFHKTPEEYFSAKRLLFEPGREEHAVIWVDDPYGQRIANYARKHCSVITVGSKNADYVLSGFVGDRKLGSRARLHRRGREIPLALAIPGLPNMVDAAIAIAMLEAVGIDGEQVAEGLAEAQIPGRMQQVVLEDGPLVIVDFAHTPQAVGAVLETLSRLGPVTAVLGCGGDRDAEKRAPMGAAAAELCQKVVVTDDNPRTEDPAAIRAQVLGGASGKAEVREIADRAEAIAWALRYTPKNGIVAILGKGHEKGQILRDRIIDFSDVEVARRAWREVRGL